MRARASSTSCGRSRAGRTATPTPRSSITHGFTGAHLIVGDRIEVPDGLWEPFRDRPNLNIEVSFPVRIGDLFDYPWTVRQPVLEEMVEKIGADRLLWGTDMPFQNRFCTYRQSRECDRALLARSSSRPSSRRSWAGPPPACCASRAPEPSEGDP